MGLSRSQLYRKIKALIGKSINDFIQDYRMTEAEKLLEMSDLNISEIAYDLGFTSPEYFSTVFKHKHGISPSKYRLRT